MATIRKSAKRRGAGPAPALGRSTAKEDITDDDLRKLVPSGLARAFVKSKLHEKALGVAGLGEPDDWEGVMPFIPEDVAGLDHEMMGNLLGDFASALSTALWHASKNYIEADAYDEIAEYLEDVALLDADESNEGKRKARARTDPRVVTARALQRTSYHNYVRFRDLAKTIEHRWRTVSRVGGFMGDEAEGEAASAIKGSTRGKSAGSARGAARGESKRRARR